MKKPSKRNIAGPLVRRFRKGNDWTQKEFAEKLCGAGWMKCDGGWVSRLESGDVTLRDIDLPYLLAVLGREFGEALIAFLSRRQEKKASTKPPSEHPI